MRLFPAAVLVGALALAACGDRAGDSATERRANIAQSQAKAGAAAMENRADLLDDSAENLTGPAEAQVKAEAKQLNAQADKTRDVVDEVGDRIKNGAR
jgi:hypothetical protein